MLKVRVIPTLLWKNEGLVKGVGFESWRRVGTVLPAIKVYNMRQVDELILLDITATEEGRLPDTIEIGELSAECFAPLTIGGGVRRVDDFRQLLAAGADKVTVNTGAYDRPELIREAAQRFGRQCVVVSVDARRTTNADYECFSHCGRQATGLAVPAWVREVERLGAGEILITSVEQDGTMSGYDLDLIRLVTNNVNIPVIASGGAAGYDDFCRAVNDAGASAVAAASIYHFTPQTPLEAKRFMARHGIPVRDINVVPDPA